MSRKPVIRDLPSLRGLHPKFHAFAATETKAHAIVERLRHTIAAIQQDKPRPFYSMREVSQFFDVALKTVVQAYEKLEAEGLLTRVRGSQTLVKGRKLEPLHPVRGVVGIPAYLPAFVIGTYSRAFIIRLEAELRRYHFVADLIFYGGEEQFGPNFTQRIVEHELDTVFWITPDEANIPIMHRLLDGGIHLVVAGDGKALFPRQQYFLNIERALMEAIQSWRHEGLRHVTIVQCAKRKLRHEYEVIRDILTAQGFPYDVRDLSDEELPKFVRQNVRRKDAGLIFLDHRWYEALCNQYPRNMEQLFRGTRVLLVQGPVYHPWFKGKGILVDSVRIPFEEMAARVARDISHGKTNTTGRLTTFYNRWTPRVDLGKVLREI